jgi:hypothetical protein
MIPAVGVEKRGAIGMVEAGMVMGDALYVRALLVQSCAHVRLTLRHRRVRLYCSVTSGFTSCRRFIGS